MIKLIASDLDGTLLLNGAQSLSEELFPLIKKLKEKSNNVFEFKEGTLYPILHSLEEEGLISSYWDDTTGKKRKYYAITIKGKKSLKEKNEEWKIFSESVNRVIGGVSFAN